jgi:phosphatidylinositol glycan class W
VTEYGVHWNFYATVYVVNVVLVIIQDYFQYSLPLSLGIMIAYEFSLLTLGIKQFVFYGPRNDFLSANREGVTSSFGYLAITLIGIEIGRKIF